MLALTITQVYITALQKTILYWGGEKSEGNKGLQMCFLGGRVVQWLALSDVGRPGPFFCSTKSFYYIFAIKENTIQTIITQNKETI